MHSRRFPTALMLAIFALIYFIAGKLGLKLAFVNASASAVWPPAGIALAALLLFGYRAWPAIFVGAFLVNLSTAGNIATSLAIAAGNTLEALCGTWLVNRFAGGIRVFDRAANVFKFALAAVTSTAISATLGVTSLALAGFVDWQKYAAVWLTWWLGDTTGDLVVAPVIILWAVTPSWRWSRRQALEGGLVLLLLVILGEAVFGGWFPITAKNYPISFICGPVLVWTAFRFAQRETATGIFILSAIAIWGTLHKFGPFVMETENQSLLILQSSTAVLTLTALALAAAMAERSRAEAALGKQQAAVEAANRRQAEELNRRILDSAHDAFISINAESRITAWNRQAEATFGWSAAEAIDQQMAEMIIPPKDRDAHRRGLGHFLQTGEGPVLGKRIELTALHRSGREFPIELTITPIRKENSYVFCAFVHDITDRKRAESELRESELRRRLLIDSIGDYAIFMLDTEGKITTWSPGAERIKGYQAAEIVGQHFSRFYPPEDIAAGKPEAELKVAAATGRFAEEGRRLRKDGTPFWASVVISAVRDENNQLVGFAKVTRDLTERRQAEEQRVRFLQEQRAREVAEAEKERSRFLSRASSVLASSLDYEATLQKLADIVVPQYADWCSVEILEGDKIEQVAVAHVDPAKVELAHELQRRWSTDPDGIIGTANILRTGKSALYPDIPDELLVQTTQDAEHPRIARELHLRSGLGVPLIARGKTLGAITLVWTESDRRYNHDDVSLMEELGLRAGITVDNARLYQETQKSVRLRDEFLSIASHELKTPLTSLQLQVSSIQRSVRQGRPEQVTLERLAPKVNSIDRQVERLNKLINDLLDVSRATTGRLQLNLENVELAQVVDEVAARFKDDLAAAQCPLSLDLEQGIAGHWDRLRVDQIVANFIANAIKYGTGKPIEITTTACGPGAVLAVRDYGIGIAAKDQDRIFERFGRAVPTDRYGGFGLGLWIVRIFVEAMGGTVKVESQPDAGSTFIVELPLSGKTAGITIP